MNTANVQCTSAELGESVTVPCAASKPHTGSGKPAKRKIRGSLRTPPLPPPQELQHANNHPLRPTAALWLYCRRLYLCIVQFPLSGSDRQPGEIYSRLHPSRAAGGARRPASVTVTCHRNGQGIATDMHKVLECISGLNCIIAIANSLISYLIACAGDCPVKMQTIGCKRGPVYQVKSRAGDTWPLVQCHLFRIQLCAWGDSCSMRLSNSMRLRTYEAAKLPYLWATPIHDSITPS